MTGFPVLILKYNPSLGACSFRYQILEMADRLLMNFLAILKTCLNFFSNCNYLRTWGELGFGYITINKSRISNQNQYTHAVVAVSGFAHGGKVNLHGDFPLSFTLTSELVLLTNCKASWKRYSLKESKTEEAITISLCNFIWPMLHGLFSVLKPSKYFCWN